MTKTRKECQRKEVQKDLYKKSYLLQEKEMKISVIMVVILYEVLSIGIVSLLIQKKKKTQTNEDGGFALGGRSLGTWAVGTTMCLTLLGSGHLTGTWEGCLSLGETQIWHIMANGFAMAFGAVTIYRWARRMRITTIGEIATKLYCKELAVLIAAVNIAVGWAVTSFETQALGIIINSMTGYPLKITVLISSIIGLCYIIFGGTKQAAMLNQINIIILYVGMIGSLIFVMRMLPGFNFSTITHFYASHPQQYPNFLKFTGGRDHFLQVGIPILIAPFFAHCCGQQTIQTAASAKSEKALKKIAWFVGPMNVIIGAISICIAMTARTMPEKEETKLIRIFIGVGAVITCLMAQTLPTIVNMFTWIYSFMIPVFFLFIFGMWWKRNKKVGIMTFVVSWIVATAWTFLLNIDPNLPIANIHISYVIVVVSLVILIVGNLVTEGEPGYFHSKEWKESEAYKI